MATLEEQAEEAALSHYGILGMKWGKRESRKSSTARANRKAARTKEFQRYVGKKGSKKRKEFVKGTASIAAITAGMTAVTFHREILDVAYSALKTVANQRTMARGAKMASDIWDFKEGKDGVWG